MNIKITRPQNKDIGEVDQLFALVIKDNFQNEGIASTEEIEEQVQFQTNNLKQDLDSNGTEEYYLLARSRQTIIGTAAYGKPNEIIRKNWHGDLTGIPEVKSVYILPEFQGRGIGTLLFGSIIQCLGQKDIEEFCLDSGYKRAQGYWSKKLGKPSIILKDYWGKNADHLIWHCNVSDLVVA